MSWDEGYVSQIEYVYGYYRELNPLMLNLAMLVTGYRPPDSRPLRYLELGFGQGLSLNIHAAACDGEFWGNDFNPSHTANAKSMAHASGANVTILDDSFAELAARNDLPDFDVITLHGVWSWVSAENRQIILDLVRSKLALGGVLYISYNTTPGWSTIIPVRDLMMLHFNMASRPGDSVSNKIDDAIKFTQRLIDAEAGYFKNTPYAASYIDRIKNESRGYLAHELFNADWAPMPFSEVATALTDAKLSFVGDATIANIFSSTFLPDKIKKFLTGIKDQFFHQSMRDYCINQQFRKDIWVNGGSTITKLQQLQILGDMRFTLLFNPSEEVLTIPSNTGDITIDEKIARPILSVLAKNNFQPKSINELLRHPELHHINLTQACDMMFLLCGRYASPAHDEETIEKLKPQTDGLNTFLINEAQHNKQGSFLASPVTGGGVNVPYIHQLFLLAIRNGFTLPDSAVNFAWEVMSRHGHCMNMPDGTACKNDHENIGAIKSMATPFFETHLHLLNALKIY